LSSEAAVSLSIAEVATGIIPVGRYVQVDGWRRGKKGGEEEPKKGGLRVSRVESRLFRGPRSLFGWDKVEWERLFVAVLFLYCHKHQNEGIARE
jgi:hypothetical protein